MHKITWKHWSLHKSKREINTRQVDIIALLWEKWQHAYMKVSAQKLRQFTSLICGSNPISSILSASSKTTYEILEREVFPCCKWSINLPGVATTTLTPARSSDLCQSQPKNMIYQFETLYFRNITAKTKATQYFWPKFMTY